jgi:hypothetical protein
MSFYGNIINYLAKIKIKGKEYTMTNIDEGIDISDAFNENRVIFTYDEEN